MKAMHQSQASNCHLELAQAITTLSIEIIWPAAFKTLFQLAVSG